MSKMDEAALLAAKHSRIWISIAFASTFGALLMGFAAFFDVFDEYAVLAIAMMALLTLLALFCAAQGISLRSSARMQGWMPKKELTAEAIQAKNDYLNSVLKSLEAEKTAPESIAPHASKNMPSKQLNDGSPSVEETNDQIEQEAIESIDDLEEKERAVEVFESVKEAERELEEEAQDVSQLIEEARLTPSDQLELALSDEELIIAEAEALLAHASSKPQSTASKSDNETDDEDEFPTDAELTAFDLPEYANMTMASEEEDYETIPATAKSRLIAKKRISTIDRMLSRTDDIFATSRDLAHAKTEDKTLGNLPTMLRDNPALNITNPPKVKPIRLTRNGRYWIADNSGSTSNEIFDALLSLEATYNINQDILRMLGEKPDMERQTDAKRRVLEILKRTASTKPDYLSKADYLSVAYPDVDSDEVVGEWALRCKIANAVENATLPFRIAFDMMTSAAESTVLISLEIPRPECFYFAAKTQPDRFALARDYALRSAIFMAKVVLGAGTKSTPIARAIICCHTHDRKETLLSIDANPQTMPKLETLADVLSPMPIPIGYPAIRVLCENDWLDPVIPHILPTDDIWNSKRYTIPPEASDNECYPRLTAISGAKVEHDLGAHAEAPMEQAWAELDSFDGTTEDAVVALKELRDSTKIPSVQEGCERVMRALVDGTSEPGQTELLSAIFMGNKELADTIAFGLQSFTSRSAEDLIKTVDSLKDLLTPQLQISMMDDTETVFRYFHSIAERIHYNLNTHDDRKVTLVPRSYYAANEMAVYMLCQMERPQEAEPYATELLRLAPLSSNSIVTMARVLERQDRVLEAINLVNKAIANAPTVHDAALCYYRMAYLQWRMGREDLAAAAYRLTVALRTEVSYQAQRELDELMESNKELETLSPSFACRKLDEAGVTIWDLNGFRDRMAQAAILCADQTLFPAAAQLTLGLLEFQNDDALTDVYRSFLPK